MKKSACTVCRASVIKATSISGEPLIVDADPVHDGNVWLEQLADSVRAHVLSPKALAALGGPQHIPHFNNCRNATSGKRA